MRPCRFSTLRWHGSWAEGLVFMAFARASANANQRSVDRWDISGGFTHEVD